MNNIHIVDSYKISKLQFKDIIFKEARLQKAEIVIENRTIYSLKSEWAIHNLCYNLHLWRKHTKDVDLNYPNKYEWIYKILGWIALILIK